MTKHTKYTIQQQRRSTLGIQQQTNIVSLLNKSKSTESTKDKKWDISKATTGKQMHYFTSILYLNSGWFFILPSRFCYTVSY